MRLFIFHLSWFGDRRYYSQAATTTAGYTGKAAYLLRLGDGLHPAVIAAVHLVRRRIVVTHIGLSRSQSLTLAKLLFMKNFVFQPIISTLCILTSHIDLNHTAHYSEHFWAWQTAALCNMPSVWSEHFTKEGRVYYYNKSSKQSSWDKPADFDSSESSVAVAAAASSVSGKTSEAAAAVEWEELWDPKNERAYYYNRTLRKTQWARPEGVEIKLYAGAARKDKAAVKSSSSTAAAATNGSDQTKPQAVSTTAVASVTTSSPKKKAAQETNGHAQKHHHHHHNAPETTAADENAKAVAAKSSAKSPTKKRLMDKESADVDEETDTSKRPRRSSVSGGEAVEGDEPQHKKRKKKAKREKSESIAAVATSAMAGGAVDRKKTPRRESDKRMIIWDDEDQQQSQTAREPIPEKDTEDGKEATRLLHEMTKPDAIMEVNVLNVINGFLRAHNESDGPEILVEKLSSSYRGYAQMIGLVTSWLDAVPMTRSALDHKVVFDVAEGSVVEHKGPSWEPADEILYDHLKEIVMQHYEPKLVGFCLVRYLLVWQTDLKACLSLALGCAERISG